MGVAIISLKPIAVEPGPLDDAETLIYAYLIEHGPTDAATLGDAVYPSYQEGKINWYPQPSQWEPWARRILKMLIIRGLVREKNGKYEVMENGQT